MNTDLFGGVFMSKDQLKIAKLEGESSSMLSNLGYLGCTIIASVALAKAKEVIKNKINERNCTKATNTTPQNKVTRKIEKNFSA